MTEKDNENLEELDEDVIIEMTDDEGQSYYYREELIIPIGDKRFAVLAPVDIGEDCGCGDEECDCCSDDDNVFIARIDTDENGEDVYVDPTDEEFEQVREAYEELMAEEDDED